MTTGALIFARNNEQIDYKAMAHWSAKNIERHLGIPTHIVTDNSPNTNSRHFSDVGNVTWYNHNRMDAYRLSPWERTLVLDADYVVASNQLQAVLDVDQDFLAHRWAYDVTECNTFEGLNYFGNNHMPMWWATVMMFRKSKQAEQARQREDMDDEDKSTPCFYQRRIFFIFLSLCSGAKSIMMYWAKSGPSTVK